MNHYERLVAHRNLMLAYESSCGTYESLAENRLVVPRHVMTSRRQTSLGMTNSEDRETPAIHGNSHCGWIKTSPYAPCMQANNTCMEHLGTDETKNHNQDDLVESSGDIQREREKERGEEVEQPTRDSCHLGSGDNYLRTSRCQAAWQELCGRSGYP